MNAKLLLGMNLKRLRTGAGLSQLELSNETNLAHNFINDVEKGRKWVSAKTMDKFSKVLKAEPFQFFLDAGGLGGKERDTIRSYLDDIINGLITVLKEFQTRYLADMPGKDKR